MLLVMWAVPATRTSGTYPPGEDPISRNESYEPRDARALAARLFRWLWGEHSNNACLRRCVWGWRQIGITGNFLHGQGG